MPPLTEAEQTKDDQLASGQLTTISLSPAGGEPPEAGSLLQKKTSKSSGASATKATRAQKGKSAAKPSLPKKPVVPQLVPQVDVGQVLDIVEATIGKANPNVGIPEALLEKVKLEIDDVIEFTGIPFKHLSC